MKSITLFGQMFSNRKFEIEVASYKEKCSKESFDAFNKAVELLNEWQNEVRSPLENGVSDFRYPPQPPPNKQIPKGSYASDCRYPPQPPWNTQIPSLQEAYQAATKLKYEIIDNLRKAIELDTGHAPAIEMLAHIYYFSFTGSTVECMPPDDRKKYLNEYSDPTLMGMHYYNMLADKDPERFEKLLEDILSGNGTQGFMENFRTNLLWSSKLLAALKIANPITKHLEEKFEVKDVTKTIEQYLVFMDKLQKYNSQKMRINK